MAITRSGQLPPSAGSADPPARITSIPPIAAQMLTRTKHNVLTRAVLIPDISAARRLPPVAERIGPSLDRRIRKSAISTAITYIKKVHGTPSGLGAAMLVRSGIFLSTATHW